MRNDAPWWLWVFAAICFLRLSSYLGEVGNRQADAYALTLNPACMPLLEQEEGLPQTCDGRWTAPGPRGEEADLANAPD